MTPFVWSLMGEDAAEPLSHIITRKEAERKAGGDEFWWGIGSTIAKELEEVAVSNGGSLPVFFLALGLQGGGGSKQKICVWNGWRSRDGNTATISLAMSSSRATTSRTGLTTL